VHADGEAAEAARAVQARAYTIGHDIVFGAGQYMPNAEEGRRLLAHELTHVVQRTSPASRRSSEGSIPRPDIHQGSGAVVARVPTEEGIKRGDYEFSTQCGWIDWGHANPSKAKEILATVTANAKAGSRFTVTMSTWAHGGTISAEILRDLNADERQRVALGLFQKLSMTFEEAQEDTDFIKKSGFATEDLSSNLIGFYRAAKGYSVTDGIESQ
jgi:hypothetical protein